ncbi:hypothetical protein LINGRAHAP2_LOCUS1668 [Linum grandiflorum]
MLPRIQHSALVEGCWIHTGVGSILELLRHSCIPDRGLKMT